MKWFFALKESGSQFTDYAEMLKTAVFTAQNQTSLEPFFLYDGSENELTRWLRERGVQIIGCRTFLHDHLQRVAEKRNDPGYLSIGGGAFLRTEIPRVTAEQGFPDEFVLYTDVDVIFLRDVARELAAMTPNYFAVAPEFFIDDYRAMNSGVMVMNLPRLREKDAEFRKFMVENIEILVDNAWDQGAYKMFYDRRFTRFPLKRLTKHLFRFEWDELAPEFNWKTYWGVNPEAGIVHFHGPKPHQKDLLNSENPPPYLEPLRHLVNDAYFEYCRIWEENHRSAAAGR